MKREENEGKRAKIRRKKAKNYVKTRGKMTKNGEEKTE